MSLKLVSATDLDRAQVETLFQRAGEISHGAAPNVKGTLVALALANPNFPLPLHIEQTLRGGGADIVSLTSSNPDALVREINNAHPRVTLFSSSETGAAADVARQTNSSFLNAGDGVNENPVRALMDAYAIYTLKGELQNNRVALLGNLKFSAEAHSLAHILSLFGARLSFISPAALSMPYDLTDQVRLSAYEVEETNDLATTLLKTDALYLSNIDSFRVEKKIYDKFKTFYALTPDTFAGSKEGIIVLGEWDGAQNLLAATRPHIELAAAAMLLALIEQS